MGSDGSDDDEFLLAAWGFSSDLAMAGLGRLLAVWLSHHRRRRRELREITALETAFALPPALRPPMSPRAG